MINMWFHFSMDSPLYGTIFVVGSMLVSVVGLLIVRRFVNLDYLKKHLDIASYFFLMIGTLYAVLIAFAIFVVWTQFQDAGTNLEREVNAVGDLSRMSAGLPEPEHSKVRSALLEYIHAVLEDEFPAMAEGRDSPRTWAAVQKLMDAYTGGTNLQHQGAGLHRRVVEASERSLELPPHPAVHQPRNGAYTVVVPAVLGGIVLIAFTYFFGHESVAWQARHDCRAGGNAGVQLVPHVAYNGPFDGTTRVNPTPYEVELQHVRRGARWHWPLLRCLRSVISRLLARVVGDALGLEQGWARCWCCRSPR